MDWIEFTEGTAYSTTLTDPTTNKLALRPLSLTLCLIPHCIVEYEHCAMTSQARRSTGAKSQKSQKSNQSHSRSSSSTTTSASLHVETPSDTSPSSPSFSMPLSTDETNGVDGLAADMVNTKINGNGRVRSSRPYIDRKKSTPMMPPFMVSAPGKVIVFGEHAVVHGKVHQISKESIGLILLADQSPACYRSSNLPSLLSARHSSLQIKTNNIPPVPRY